MIKTIERILNALELVGIILTLVMAFLFQIILHELPCPLCLLQRIGFISIAFGFLLNLRFGLRPSHYAIALLSALFTAFVALRQVALHVVPGTGSYGSAFLGLHLYTWSFIASMLIVIVTTLMLSMDKQYQKTSPRNRHFKWITPLLFGIMTMLILANVVSVFLECGINACPDDPMSYRLLSHGIYI